MYDDDGISSEVARQQAQSAALFGTLALTLCMLGYCTMYMTAFIALPVSLLGLYQARNALSGTDIDEVTEVLGRHAMMENIIALAFSALLSAIMLLIIGFYGLLILTAMGGAAFTP